jgi:predicted metal-dependent hydrolase
LEVGSVNIEIVKKRIKNIHLAVYPPNGRVRLASPIDVEDEAIRLFAISKLAWIKKQQRKFADQHREPPRKYINRESHYFEGRRYLLRVHEGEVRSRVEIKTKTYIDLYIHENSTIDEREQVMTNWYRKELKASAQPLIEKWQEKMNVELNSWGVKQMTTKWGTCNIEAKRILLNLELAKKPERCLEYIIAHELVHLFERKHNDRFFQFMNKFMPQWKTYRDELTRLPVSHVNWEY